MHLQLIKPLLTASVALFALTACSKAPATAPRAMPPMPVLAEAVEKVASQPVEYDFIGQTLAVNEVKIQPRVEGFLERVAYKQGAPVKKDDLLFTIDPQPFRAKLSQAKGDLAKAQAALTKARGDVKRYTPLMESNAISRQMYEDALAARDSAEASVVAAKALVELAEIQLGYTEIRSPISGLAGISQYTVGNLVGRADSAQLTTVSDTSRIRVRFSVSESQYLFWARRQGNTHAAELEQLRDAFVLQFADKTDYVLKGSFYSRANTIDAATGTFTIEVIFDNPSGILSPGQFVRIRFAPEVRKDALLISQRAVQELQGKTFAYVVHTDTQPMTAEYRALVLGPRIGRDKFIVEQGLAAGELVVVEGAQKLADKAPVSMADGRKPNP